MTVKDKDYVGKILLPSIPGSRSIPIHVYNKTDENKPVAEGIASAGKYVLKAVNPDTDEDLLLGMDEVQLARRLDIDVSQERSHAELWELINTALVQGLPGSALSSKVRVNR